MLEKLFAELIDTMNEYEFMINHEKEKLKEVNTTIRRLYKVNEKIENKVDITPYLTERDKYLNSLADLKKDAKKLNKIYKILIGTKEYSE